MTEVTLEDIHAIINDPAPTLPLVNGRNGIVTVRDLALTLLRLDKSIDQFAKAVGDATENLSRNLLRGP